MRLFLIILTFALVAVVSIGGFQGRRFTETPWEIFPDMDRQAKYKTQSPSTLFRDGRTDQLPPSGTVPKVTDFQAQYARQAPKDAWLEDRYEATGIDVATGNWGRGFPEAVRAELRAEGNAFLALGETKYAIYCNVCHGAAGDGKGVASKYDWGAIANLVQDPYLGRAEGDIFNTITHGKGQMGPYGAKLTVRERWAIVAYVRVLQRARNAQLTDVPADQRTSLQ